MNVRSIYCILAAIIIVGLSGDLLAQSSSRGSSSRGRSFSPTAQGRPTRMGPVRSGLSSQPRGPVAAGILNSVGRTAPSSSGSGSRRLPTTTGFQSPRPTYGGGATTGLTRPAISTGSRGNAATRSRARGAGSTIGAATLGGPALPDGFRVWVDASGRYSIQGKLAAQRDGVVWIRRTDGQLVKLPKTQLSQPDQKFLSPAG